MQRADDPLTLNSTIHDSETNFELKSRTRIGTWNVRTVLNASKLLQIIWNQCTKNKNNGFSLLLWSGKDENADRHNGILLNRRAKKSFTL